MVHEEANLTSNRSPQELVQSVLVSWWLWGLLLWTDSVTHTQQTMQRQILNCIDAIAKKKKTLTRFGRAVSNEQVFPHLLTSLPSRKPQAPRGKNWGSRERFLFSVLLRCFTQFVLRVGGPGLIQWYQWLIAVFLSTLFLFWNFIKFDHPLATTNGAAVLWMGFVKKKRSERAGK